MQCGNKNKNAIFVSPLVAAHPPKHVLDENWIGVGGIATIYIARLLSEGENLMEKKTIQTKKEDKSLQSDTKPKSSSKIVKLNLQIPSSSSDLTKSDQMYSPLQASSDKTSSENLNTVSFDKNKSEPTKRTSVGLMACKVFRTSHITYSISATEKEIFISSVLSHPNIARTLYANISPPMIFSEYYTCSLDHFIHSPVICYSQFFAYYALVNLLSAVAYLHGYGLMHLDIKPGNILLNEKGEVFLCDFGDARFVLLLVLMFSALTI
jgi:serine/threonine protein kinase